MNFYNIIEQLKTIYIWNTSSFYQLIFFFWFCQHSFLFSFPALTLLNMGVMTPPQRNLTKSINHLGLRVVTADKTEVHNRRQNGRPLVYIYKKNVHT